ncbi:MAG: PSD1 and planctomycete cytochrome C domain-containing protein [Verrucomicrobiota bacterium]
MVLQLIVILAVAGTSESRAAGKTDFERDVRPILSNRCFKCHGPDESTRKGKLRLDLAESAHGQGESGKIAIVPGKPAESEFIKRLHAADPDDRMPPASAKMELSDTEKSVLKQWISEGAEYQPHWAFVAPKKPAAKSIDELVGKKLAEQNLKPSPEADQYELIRRVTLDLIGLPPTPEEATAFANDKSPDAYEKVVDRLLASPHYGERWARRWLDLARYADTNGYEKDRERQIWPWRDWVIRSLNADMPFNEFTIKQLAGDMLPNATSEDVTATGFHRNTMLNEEGGADPLEYRYHAMTNRVATTGTTWLGLTVGCAQCHTHKYDPILHTEYFGLMAFFNNADDIDQDLPDPALAAKQADREKKAESLIATLPAKWPADKHGDGKWFVTDPSSVTAASGESATIKDRVVLFPTAGQDRDSYEVLFSGSSSGIDRLRLETLADRRIPSGGPGRTSTGNFVLSEIEVFTRSKSTTATWEKVQISDATATAEQSGFPVASAIDGKPETGWAVEVAGGARGKDRSADFFFANPLPAGNRDVKIVLAQNFGDHHTIGSFRISLGKEENKASQQPASELAFKSWLEKSKSDSVPWTTLTPSTLDSNEPVLTADKEGAIFVSGDTTKDDRFTLTFQRPQTGITALRLEALTDKRLPGFGPGKVYYEGTPGDFFLYHFSVKADGKDIRLANTTSTAGDANQAIDSDNQTGWTINGHTGEDQTAVFQLAEPLPATSVLTIEMRMGRYYASTLGKFRLSTSNATRVPAARVFPETTSREALYRHFLLNAPQLAEQTKPIRELLSVPVPQRTLVLQERADHPRVTRLHARGEFSQPAQEIQPHVPAFLPPISPGLPNNRLGFSEWLVSRGNPLTARVTVNRDWQAFFGTGIVKTVDDFGFQGELPVNPELLDWLAVTFMETGWSVKKLHRLIVTSATYKQDSRVTPELLAKDPQNRLLARGPRARVEAEMIRDISLSAAGLLSDKLFGPPVRPPQPASVTEGAFGGMNWPVSGGEDRYRRGLYTFAKRSAPFASFQTFDAPTGEACVARREVSNTPLQSLVLLNDEVYFEAAQAFGKKIAAQPGSLAQKTAYAFQRCLTRPPTPEEIEKLTAFYAAQHKRLQSGELKKPDLKNSTTEEIAWMTVARVLLNLDETITKN